MFDPVKFEAEIRQRKRSDDVKRAYETLDGKELRDFLLKDMVESVKHHPLDDVILKALSTDGASS